jgi:hypothetical protein
MNIVTPLSIPAVGRRYKEALPEPTLDLCGKMGTLMAVGFSPAYLVYRGTFDTQSNTGSWHWLYTVIQ